MFRRLWDNVRRSRLKLGVVAAGCGCALCGIGGGIWGFHFEPSGFQVNHYSVRLHNWHPELNGLTVAVLTDIHQVNSPEELARLRRIVAAVNAESPDIVVLLGDFMGKAVDVFKRNASQETIALILRDLHGRFGCYAVLGNHDVWWGADIMRDALESVGIPVFENSYKTLLIRGKELNIIGLPDLQSRSTKFNPAVLPGPETPALLLSHNPDYFQDADLPYEFMLSGHTHGGQVKLPFIGAVLTASKYGKRYSEGMCSRNGKQLFVSRGLGTSILHLRLMCPPEVAIVTIFQAE